MPYTFSEIEHLLQIKVEPSTYRETSENFHRTLYDNELSPYRDMYQNMLPVYKFAECPISGVECYQTIDTYSISNLLSSIHNSLMYGRWFEANHPVNPQSPFLLGTHGFRNLHNHIPSGHLNVFSEVPYISPQYLPENIESYVVIHSLPVCEVMDGKFVPTYTLFMLTYFSRDPRAVIEQFKQESIVFSQGDHEFYATMIDSPPYIEPRGESLRLYDMAYWARKGKLGYLDYTKDNLPLVIGEGTELPETYQNIPGRKTRFKIDSGRISPGPLGKGLIRSLDFALNLFSRK